MAAAKGACLNHVSRESTDIKRLADFYQEIFGFEQVESPKLDFSVIWLKLPSFFLHLIERNPESKLPEGPWSSTSAVADINHLPRGHHICFSIANFDSFVQTLREKGIEMHHRRLPNAKTRQVFLFDPDDGYSSRREMRKSQNYVEGYRSSSPPYINPPYPPFAPSLAPPMALPGRFQPFIS